MPCWPKLRAQVRPGTLIPFVSSSSKEPMSKASAAFTSPRGGISGGGYCGRTGAGHQHRAGAPRRPASPGPPVTFCKKTICQSRERKKGLSFTSWALWGDAGHRLGRGAGGPSSQLVQSLSGSATSGKFLKPEPSFLISKMGRTAVPMS